MPNVTFSVEISSTYDGGYEIFIGSENRSGVKYRAKDWDEVTKSIQTYIDMYVKEEV